MEAKVKEEIELLKTYAREYNRHEYGDTSTPVPKKEDWQEI